MYGEVLKRESGKRLACNQTLCMKEAEAGAPSVRRVITELNSASEAYVAILDRLKDGRRHGRREPELLGKKLGGLDRPNGCVRYALTGACCLCAYVFNVRSSASASVFTVAFASLHDQTHSYLTRETGILAGRLPKSNSNTEQTWILAKCCVSYLICVATPAMSNQCDTKSETTTKLRSAFYRAQPGFQTRP